MRCYVCNNASAEFSKTQKSKLWPACKVCTGIVHKCDLCNYEAQFSNFKFVDQETKKAAVTCQQCIVRLRGSDNDGPMYCPYDGPNDPDRYEGHGNWDDSDGYWIS